VETEGVGNEGEEKVVEYLEVLEEGTEVLMVEEV